MIARLNSHENLLTRYTVNKEWSAKLKKAATKSLQGNNFVIKKLTSYITKIDDFVENNNNNNNNNNNVAVKGCAKRKREGEKMSYSAFFTQDEDEKKEKKKDDTQTHQNLNLTDKYHKEYQQGNMKGLQITCRGVLEGKKRSKSEVGKKNHNVDDSVGRQRSLTNASESKTAAARE